MAQHLILAHPLKAVAMGVKAHPVLALGVGVKLLLTAGVIWLLLKKRRFSAA